MSDTICAVDRARVLDRLERLSKFGALDNGGICRLALTPEETEAKAILIGWAESLGCRAFIDPIGNLFLRWERTPSDLSPILVGSHLDSQPVGGNYDGVLGVIAALECVEILATQADRLHRPVEIAVWCNEEGARFNPTTMGSAVHASHLSLAEALAVTDVDGISVQSALEQSLALLSEKNIAVLPRGLMGKYHAYVELHIEQGPILEAERIAIGIVTDVQGLAQFNISASGTAGHAGAVPMDARDDALGHARRLMNELDAALSRFDGIRYTIGRVDVAPGAINTIPARVNFTLDLRHPDGDILSRAVAEVRRLANHEQLTELIVQPPVPFSTEIRCQIDRTCERIGLSSRMMVSGATHDAAQIASLCPTGMIFVPCRGGISHNENEYCAPESVFAGTAVLVETVLALAERAMQ